MDAPDVVRQIHADYIAAGADVITTNTYCTLRTHLGKAGVADRYEELNRLAGQLAVEARDSADRPALIAGSLAPMFESYRPDMVLPVAESEPVYREQAEILAEYVDFFLCETMSKSDEAVAAARAGSIHRQTRVGLVQSASLQAWAPAQRRNDRRSDGGTRWNPGDGDSSRIAACRN